MLELKDLIVSCAMLYVSGSIIRPGELASMVSHAGNATCQTRVSYCYKDTV